jgi:O-acetyl-ADP-ribose deacetylase (regulator of RNase III)
MRATAFIASSAEHLDIANTLQELLEERVEVTVWNQDVLAPSSLLLDGLIETVNDFDFGIFVFAPDDTTVIHGETMHSVRDNVLFEMGLFVGRFGRERAFIVSPRDPRAVRLATDLGGIVAVSYDVDREDHNLVAALGPAANRIARAIEKRGARPERVLRTSAPAGAGNRVRELSSFDKIIVDKRIGRASFVIINDDICRAATDVVVSSDDNHFSARGGVSKAILQKAGPEVRRQLDYFEAKQFRQGHLAVTTGGQWDRRAVFHAAVIDLDENRYPTLECIQILTRRILECAVAMGARSVAIPVLGGGFATRHLSPTQTVNAIASEIIVFLNAQNPHHDGLARVALYVFRREDIGGLPAELEWAEGEQASPDGGVPT